MRTKNFKMFLPRGRAKSISDLADDNRKEATWMSADHLNIGCGHTPASYYSFILFSMFFFVLFIPFRQGKDKGIRFKKVIRALALLTS